MTSPTIPEQTPVLDHIVSMNFDAMKRCGLDETTFHLVRIAALVALDADAASYLVNIGVAGQAGVTIEQIQGALIAIAPLVGSARVAAVTSKVMTALGYGVV